MSDQQRTTRLIEQLSRDLEPVRRIPPLGQLSAVALVAAAVVVAVNGLLHAPAGGGWPVPARGGAHGSVGLGLLLAGVAGCIAGLAAAVPGRERVVSGAGTLAAIGLGWALGTVAAVAWSQGGGSAAPPALDRMCLQNALMLAIVPVAVLVVLAVRGWIGRPLRAAALLLAGGAAVGALAVHLVCDVEGARHWLVGHVAPPWLAIVVLGGPLAVLLRRLAR